MIWLRFESHLDAEPPTIWLHATRMQGVNDELSPMVRMSVPKAFACLTLRDAPSGALLFNSWLLLLGLIPFDRHALRIEKQWDYGFQEDSSSWLQRRWRHKRHVELMSRGSRLVDELEIEPRFLPERLIRLFVRLLFLQRHRWLRAHFGIIEARPIEGEAASR
ncbi:hypothetical protein [Solimonas marina]|uniref:Ligand-binding SRPBCC domain-containing protein n=1 Tax=Solimonas marina TaxID=2714601 RepID=A0A969WDK9_9GAMM|nr:hypothetical protein [Solimonas marina]NKF22845.1 hypothetical protein [Solimonas marina]